MFHSIHNASKMVELRMFLNMVSATIISSQKVDSKGFKLKQNFIPAYTLVYDMCTQKPSLEQKMLQEFKNSLAHFIEMYIDHTQQRGQFRFSLENSARVIGWFNTLWSKFVKFMITVSKKVFAYLDRHFLPGTDEHSLYKVGLRVFRKNVCHEHNMRFFEDCFFKEVREVHFCSIKIREKKLIQNNDLLKFSDAIAIIDGQELIFSLSNRFLEEAAAYYKSIYAESSGLSGVKYYNKVSNVLCFEDVLISMCICLNPFEMARVYGLFSQILVSQYTKIFCGADSGVHGLRRMFSGQNVELMRVVNDVYRKFEGFDRIKEAYYEYLMEEGEKLIGKFKGVTGEQALGSVDEIHEFYRSHITTLTRGFNKRNQLQITLNNAMEKLISRHQGFTFILYTYCSRSRQEGTFEANKQKIDLLFGKIISKDEFVALYEAELFRKIANGSVDIHSEEGFVNYLNEMQLFVQSRCGSEVTFKLVKKINDLTEVPKSTHLAKHLPAALLFNVNVLSLTLWEKMFVDQISLNITLPPLLDSVWKTVERNFTQIQPKKKLVPLPFENKLTLETRFNKKTFLINCNLIQASIFCFLASKSYTSEQDIITELSIEKTVVQSMMETFEAVPQLLLKTTLGDFVVNWYFEQGETVIDLASKTQQASKQMSKAIKQDREILVQAAIVKFVKRAKRGTFEEVVEGVVKAIRLFKPLPQVIKASVEKLIKKGFLEQVEGGVLEYVE